MRRFNKIIATIIVDGVRYYKFALNFLSGLEGAKAPLL